MASYTTVFDLEKPDSNDPVSLDVINENYDKIDDAFNKLFKYKYYTKSPVTIANNAGIRFSANDMGMSTPDGYVPFALVRYTSGSYRVATAYINAVGEDDTNVIGIWNSSGETQSSLTVGIGILYIKEDSGIL